MAKLSSQVTFDRARESPMSAIYFLVKITVSVVVLSVISTSEVSNAPPKLLDVSNTRVLFWLFTGFLRDPFCHPTLESSICQHWRWYRWLVAEVESWQIQVWLKLDQKITFLCYSHSGSHNSRVHQHIPLNQGLVQPREKKVSSLKLSFCKL